MLTEMWSAYSKTWSQTDADRNAALVKLVSDDVTYTDPQSNVVGREAFSDHLAQFQQSMDGAYFEILDVKGHNQKTLAQWRLCNKDGGEMMLGTSFATLTDDNRFSSFVGFM